VDTKKRYHFFEHHYDLMKKKSLSKTIAAPCNFFIFRAFDSSEHFIFLAMLFVVAIYRSFCFSGGTFYASSGLIILFFGDSFYTSCGLIILFFWWFILHFLWTDHFVFWWFILHFLWTDHFVFWWFILHFLWTDRCLRTEKWWIPFFNGYIFARRSLWYYRDFPIFDSELRIRNRCKSRKLINGIFTTINLWMKLVNSDVWNDGIAIDVSNPKIDHVKWIINDGQVDISVSVEITNVLWIDTFNFLFSRKHNSMFFLDLWKPSY